MPVPLYRYSFREAKDHDEVQDWKQSHAENIRCRDAIDQMVRERYRNSILPTDIIKDACAEFGIDRVGWVLATTVSENSNDGRYRPDTRRWSMQAFYTHSMVPVGLGVRSNSTLLIPSTSAVILAVILWSTG